jgi:hypothetical protein
LTTTNQKEKKKKKKKRKKEVDKEKKKKKNNKIINHIKMKRKKHTHQQTTKRYIKASQHKPKRKNHKKLLLRSGDIEKNLGPTLKNILQTLTKSQKKKYTNYFYPKTIKLKNEYQHIATPFTSFIDYSHPTHNANGTTHPKLTEICQNISHIKTEKIIFALIVTIAPKPNLCETNTTTQNIH